MGRAIGRAKGIRMIRKTSALLPLLLSACYP